MNKITVFLFAFIAIAAGCGRGPKPDMSRLLKPPPGVSTDGVDYFPGGVALKPGDILLGRSYGTMGAIFANFGSLPGKYSHAALYYRDSSGCGRVINIRPLGMDICGVAEYFSRYNRLALVRYRQPLDEQKICQSAQRWFEIDRSARIKPDYRLNRYDHSELFCLELVSVIFTENGLPDPFAKTYKVIDNPAAAYIVRELKLDITEIPSPNSVLEEPAFKVIAEWLRPDYDIREEIMHNTLVETLAGYFTDGYEVRNVRLGGRIKIKLLLTHFRFKRLFIATRRRFPPLPMALGMRSLGVGYMIYQHISCTKKTVRQAYMHQPLEVCGVSEVQELTRRAADHYRDRFYMRKSSGSESVNATPSSFWRRTWNTGPAGE